MYTYALVYGSTAILRSDGAVVPADPGNVDYQAYLAWVAAGNVADPAPAAAPPSVIPVAAFWARFGPAEQAAIQAAAAANPEVAVPMSFAAVIGQVNLLSGPLVTQWMAALVAAGTITAARSAQILTP
jgi:hypothetical protein